MLTVYEELFLLALDEENGNFLPFTRKTIPYGLSGAVFTRDLERGVRFARRLRIGMAHVNDQPVNDLPNNPFGGEKNSGIGRFNGNWAIEAFTSDQWVSVQHAPRPYPADARALGGPWAGG